LLSLGLSEQLTSLVWLAGPISGLIAQPVIGEFQYVGLQVLKHEFKSLCLTYVLPLGAISDSSTSKYRRRYWIVMSTVVLVISTLCLAYCQDISAIFVDLFGGGEGDWDPKRIKQVS
jgi:solute carrier family 45, member 1/2/4